VLAAALLLAVPSLVHAQRSGRLASVSTAPRSRAVGAHGVATSHATASRKGVRAKAAIASDLQGDPLTIQQLLDPFPGFGFDFEHLNAIDRDLAIKALIDPITEQRLALAERIGGRSGFGTSGFFLLDGGGAYVMPSGPDATDQAPSQSQQQPQVIVVQMPATRQADQESSTAIEAPESAPPRDVGEFTLILRNGSQIQAVAFTRMNDKIVYITPSGGRHTLAVADLDTDSTERTNQEDGTPLQFPF